MEKIEKIEGIVVGERWKEEKGRTGIYKGRKTDSDKPKYDRSRHASSLGHPRTYGFHLTTDDHV